MASLLFLRSYCFGLHHRFVLACIVAVILGAKSSLGHCLLLMMVLLASVIVLSALAGTGDLYYLRMVLLYQRGATSFAHLRTVNGVECATFKAAAIALGVLEDDAEHHVAMQQTAAIAPAPALRAFFVALLTNAEVVDPLWLWQEHKHSIIDDFLYQARQARIFLQNHESL